MIENKNLKTKTNKQYKRGSSWDTECLRDVFKHGPSAGFKRSSDFWKDTCQDGSTNMAKLYTKAMGALYAKKRDVLYWVL